MEAKNHKMFLWKLQKVFPIRCYISQYIMRSRTTIYLKAKQKDLNLHSKELILFFFIFCLSLPFGCGGHKNAFLNFGKIVRITTDIYIIFRAQK